MSPLRSLLEALGRGPAENELYRLVVEHSPYCIHRIDLEGKLSAMNPAGLVMLGLEREEDVVGAPYLESVHEDDRPRIAALLDGAYRDESAEFEFRATNGRVFQSNFVPVRDEAGRLVSLMGITQDITDRVGAMEGLRASEEKLQLVLAAAGLDAWELDPATGALEWASVGSGPMVGVFGDDLPHTLEAYAEHIHEEDREPFQNALRQRIDQNQCTHRHRLHTAVGEVVVEWTGRMVGAPAADTRCLGIVRDVTEQVRLEGQLVQVQKLEGLGVLAGGVAHDFNNLLGGIMGNIDLVLDGLPPASQARASLSDALTASEHAAELCQQLLAYSGQAPLHEEAVDLSAVVAEMTPLLEACFTRSRPRLELAEGDAVVRGSVTQLRQVVMNLITNAADATASVGTAVVVRIARMAPLEPGPDERVVVGARPADDCVLIEVTDDGVGMDDAVMACMFDPFFTSKEAGRGLGLSAVLGIVRSHGGALSVMSAPGVGTRIRVWLPAHDAPIEVPGDLPPEAGLDGTGRTVLVVDDEPRLVDLARRVLGRSGWNVVTAASGRDALARIDADPDIDAAVIDLTMPGMTGTELGEELRRRELDCPIVLTSGFSEADVSAALRDGIADVFLPKPYRVTQLVEAVEKAVSRE